MKREKRKRNFSPSVMTGVPGGENGREKGFLKRAAQKEKKMVGEATNPF